MSEKFLCPKCKTKVPFKETFNFKKNHITKCSNCGAELTPKNVKSWNFGFFIGFIGVVIPAYTILHLYKSFLLAVFVGIVTGAIAILGIAYYTYLTTEFKEID
ncbi:hypothetical protein [Psychroflexus salis]|uniref:Cxxc_20_cxxc protein n=1 Tax=Psychroflexus salis TaxID=1526574 RepID=A0A917A3D3_9FLAO|nr:hypothetical protein [Psychroflexus salis]GGE23097.1 hypothetical protein GCM10010831_25000 [Psychroflexus salis]